MRFDQARDLKQISFASFCTAPDLPGGQGQWRAVAYNDGNPDPEPKGKGKEFKQNGHGKGWRMLAERWRQCMRVFSVPGSADGEEGREPGARTCTTEREAACTEVPSSGEIQGKRLHAVTFYNPVAWFMNKKQEQSVAQKSLLFAAASLSGILMRTDAGLRYCICRL